MKQNQKKRKKKRAAIRKKREKICWTSINEQNRSNFKCVKSVGEYKKIKEAQRIFILKFQLKCDKYFSIFM